MKVKTIPRIDTSVIETAFGHINCEFWKPAVNEVPPGQVVSSNSVTQEFMDSVEPPIPTIDNSRNVGKHFSGREREDDVDPGERGSLKCI